MVTVDRAGVWLDAEPLDLPRAADSPLTERETEILRLVAGNLANKQIARSCCLSLYTVKNHVHAILEKLHAASRREAVSKARRRGWI